MGSGKEEFRGDVPDHISEKALVACRGANITRFRIWAPKGYLPNQLQLSINSVAVPQ